MFLGCSHHSQPVSMVLLGHENRESWLHFTVKHYAMTIDDIIWWETRKSSAFYLKAVMSEVGVVLHDAWEHMPLACQCWDRGGHSTCPCIGHSAGPKLGFHSRKTGLRFMENHEARKSDGADIAQGLFLFLLVLLSDKHSAIMQQITSPDHFLLGWTIKLTHGC